jgi:hypothetical protein
VIYFTNIWQRLGGLNFVMEDDTEAFEEAGSG